MAELELVNEINIVFVHALTLAGRGGVAHIVLADDDALLCELVRFKLVPHGHRLTVVSDGQAALDAVALEMPDLLILDSMMPVMSGNDVLREIKAKVEFATLPVIMLTARRAEEDVVAALQAGANDYITKPFLPDELVLRIRAALAERGAARNVS